MKLTVKDKALDEKEPRLVIDSTDASEAVVARILWEVILSAAIRHVDKKQAPFVLKNDILEIRMEL